ncbi:Mrp/NBP35 family ATP-binding protein [Pyrobaculum aerophilum]|uniref:Iron-sulfur cluster carrier protein n=2 Tax=Pyrobaculum aerophilum TaxID=13773 RepID=A0A371R1N9_9CREN|nr:Mrp/NBP35 family ATP-binding protein [Pyrobaculum aerophilum]RFA97448.1 ATP-binding protein [Pyrobaculum aerophilum]
MPVKVNIRGQAATPGSLADLLKDVKLKLVTISGKGGVGKSLVTTSIAVGFAMRGYRVGILDGDVYGPTVPKMLGLSDSTLYVDQKTGRIIPVVGPLGIKVVSIEFALPGDDTAVIWRAPLVNQALRDFISQVEWGPLDVLVVDLPPGTGDAPLTIAQSLQGGLDGSVIVTIPTEISRRIVLKSIDFSRKLNIKVAGVVENMCCFKCPDNGKVYYIFGKDAGKRIAEAAGVPFLGGIPIDPEFSQYLDSGRLHEFLGKDNETAKAVLAISDKLIEMYKDKLSQQTVPKEKPKRISLLKLPGEEEEENY